MSSISVIEKTKDYVVVRIPRRFFARADFLRKELTEAQALKILRAGMREYRQGKTSPLSSLRELRYGN